MSEKENTSVVRQAYENFKTGNIPALLNLFSEQIDWQLPEMKNVPFAGKRKGREQVGQFFAMLEKEQEVVTFEPKEFVAAGDTVVALGHYAWRVKSTGQKFESNWAHVFTVQGGQIVGFQEYMDTAAVTVAYQKR